MSKSLSHGTDCEDLKGLESNWGLALWVAIDEGTALDAVEIPGCWRSQDHETTTTDIGRCGVEPACVY